MDQIGRLGIDAWSILLYMINVGILLVVLIYLLYKPILKILDQRQKQISDSIHEANLLREEFSKELEASEKEKEKIQRELNEEMENLRRFIDKKQAELTAEMETARAEMMRKAEEEIERRKKSLLKDAEKQVVALMSQIILKFIQDKVPEKIIQESIGESWETYTKSN